MRVARFASTQQQCCLRRHSTLNGKVHLSFSNQPSCSPPQPASSMSSSASTHDPIPMNTRNSQLIHSFIQTQHEQQIRTSFSVVELHSTHYSHYGWMLPIKYLCCNKSSFYVKWIWICIWQNCQKVGVSRATLIFFYITELKQWCQSLHTKHKYQTVFCKTKSTI